METLIEPGTMRGGHETPAGPTTPLLVRNEGKQGNEAYEQTHSDQVISRDKASRVGAGLKKVLN